MSFGERLMAAVVRGAIALPVALKRRLAGAPIRRDGQELDLDIQLMMSLARIRPRPPLSGRTPVQARADLVRAARTVAGRPQAMAAVRELRVAGAEGPLPARLYVPFEADAAAAPGPLLVYFHGGGWVIGDIDTHDPLTRALAHSAGVRVLSVAYRLAPEHPFPAPVDDALAAFRDAVARAEELEVDARRVAVGGDSAGAHLATVTAQTTVRDGGPSPVFQLLIVPPTDLLHEHPSKRIFAEGFMHTRANGLWYEHHFIGDGDRSDPRASPLLAEDVGGVAPALIATAGFDPLRDEGEAYAAKLRAAGVPVVLWRHSGYVHSFMGMLGVGDGPRLAVATMGGVLRGALAE